jgi:hypothetical protein
MAEIKMYVADTIDLVQKWVNENNLDYDSIKLQCHSCDNSTSGAVFTVYGREGNQANSDTANCAIFDVSNNEVAVCDNCGSVKTTTVVKSCNDCGWLTVINVEYMTSAQHKSKF